VSYSFLEPEWPVYCECKYDEARDEMDREDCPFHCDMESKMAEEELPAVTRKRLARTNDARESAA
jgi:hypothetical protein